MSDRQAVRAARQDLDDAGLRGSVLVRDLHTGREVALDADEDHPIASLVKVPLAVATLTRVHARQLDGATRLTVPPGAMTIAGPIGLSRFRHPAEVAVDDLLYLSTSCSDSTAADALFGLTPPGQVADVLAGLGLRGIGVRHTMGALTRTPMEALPSADAHLAHSLAIGGGTPGRGHPVPQLDVTRANAASARALMELLQALWTPSRIDPATAARVRELMRHNVLRHRLAPDLASDASTWSSKTGTLLNLRHEMGVVEHADGAAYGVVVLTESRVSASVQPVAEATMARVARSLRDHLRA